MSVGIDLAQFSLLVRAFSVLFALGLVLIAFEALKRRKKQVLIFVALAFLAYMARVLIGLMQVAYPALPQPLLLVFMSDVLDLFTLLLIFLAVLKE